MDQEVSQEVSNEKELNQLIQRVKQAQEKFSQFSQQQVDHIFKQVALAANDMRISLAKTAVQETGMGVMEDKIIKNHFAAEFVYNKYADTQTCGILEHDQSSGYKKVAEPLGIIAGIVPTTNPTSTVIFKALIALKTRNAIIFSPHPRAKSCTVEAAKIVLDAAVKAGAPENIIGWINHPSVALSQTLMSHPDVALVLATGGGAMVRAAYSSGNPALGVGSGNTPAIIDETADIKMAVSSIILSKTFDNGLICASEQSVVVVAEKYDEVQAELKSRGAYILSPTEKKKLKELLFTQEKGLNIEVIGQPASKIAAMAKIAVPNHVKLLVVEADKIGREDLFSKEKLSPILTMYRADDFHHAIERGKELVAFGGMGHTAVLYTAPTNVARIEAFEKQVPVGRLLINMPSSHGAIGDIYNFRLEPSLTLGCGSWGRNAVSENIGIKHLMNVKNVVERRENMLWFRVPPKIYFKPGCLPVALKDIQGKKRVLIVTDKPLFDLNYTDKIEAVLDEMNIEHHVFYDVQANPTLSNVNNGVQLMNQFQPDVIIALGGGSPIDAAKIMWLLYEHPEESFHYLTVRFMDIKKRIYDFPKLGSKITFIAVPTTSGTGSEVTPFAVITDDKTGKKYPIADYELTPHMAIIDSDFTLSMPRSLTAFSGLDAITHALEAYVSICATEYTNSLALQALSLLFEYLPRAYQHGHQDPLAREKVHHAATLAGMAFANAFLGICHSMSHKLGAQFHLAHGLANAIIIPHVIRYNATDRPTKQAAFSQYQYPQAKKHYAEIADHLGLGGQSEKEKVENLVQAIENLKVQVGCPLSIKEAGVSQEDFFEHLDRMTEEAYDDQCTGANPRYPLISELKEIYIKAFGGGKKTAKKTFKL